ncbi:LPS export ABC transporter permease LptG [Magnetospirillum moscoviense]|uniref:LPS export ABC transporter permease LptG n=1 Tax=Magnetospirillum moscoviense TaxID=1437059 RepID=A0A178MDI0_9PROT|nr:LPS export ABC transporter permease LptG [Magnetospirillum moscoviense]OAN45914.1 LPS export ABC transporter permease LptG [Magnetospirillum moscoviense]
MRLSLTLSTYIGRQFVLAFAAALLVIAGVILLFDVIELIRRAAGRGELGLATLMTMALLKLPQMVHMILPFAVMIGAMLSFWRLTRTHELVVARAAGISAWEFLAPVVVVSVLVGIFEVTAVNPLGAAMYARFQRMQDELLLNKSGAFDLSEIGLWLREGDESRQVVVHAEDVRQEGLALHLKEVHIFLFDGPDRFARRLSAVSGTLENGTFALNDVWQMEGGKPSQHLDKVSLPTELTLERVQDNFAAPEAMSFWQLPAFISFFEKAGFAATKHRMHFQALLASPLLYASMVLIAALFSLRPNMRAGGLLIRVGGGVGAGFAIYLFSKVIFAFGLSSTLPQILAAWSPALVALLIGVSGLFYLEDG